MDIETKGAIELFFPNTSLALVYYEALANSLDAGADDITISIYVESYDKPDTLRICIRDNGTGFTDESFERFKKLLKPKDGFHKGIGRLVFLKYFDRVDIDSFFSGLSRHFTFKSDFDPEVPLVEHKNGLNYTELKFKGFQGKKIKSYGDIKPDVLKDRIIDHFLPTFNEMRNEGRDFNIRIDLSVDKENKQKEFFSDSLVITSRDLPDMELIEIQDDSIDICNSVNMHYSIRKVPERGRSLIAVCIDGRTIEIGLLPQLSIPIGYSVIVLFSSEIFKARADSARQNLALPGDMPIESLKRVFKREIGKLLSDKVPTIEKRNKETRKTFENKYPHLLGYFESDTVGLVDKDDALKTAQDKLFKEQKEILECESLDDRAYDKSLELSSRALTEYVLYREKIIQKISTMDFSNSEDEIHNLIVPKRNVFRSEDFCESLYRNNAWLLDDKFMSFSTILSEKRMDTIIREITTDKELEEAGRPDIAMIFSSDPFGNEVTDVVIVEIKKKSDDEEANMYAVTQLLQRASKLAKYCPKIQRIWYYAVIHISDELSERLEQFGLDPLFSKGKVFYKEFTTKGVGGVSVPTPTTVLSYDAIVEDAKSRNKTFLEILKDSMKQNIENHM